MIKGILAFVLAWLIVACVVQGVQKIIKTKQTLSFIKVAGYSLGITLLTAIVVTGIVVIF